MPIIPAFAQPNGNQNMTIFGERNDDTTVNLPQMEFSFFYNKRSVNVLYSSGNSWLGFGNGTEHLQINRRDASYNKLFYVSETDHGLHTFRIRFEGNSSYSSWGANDLVWEFTVFEDGVLQLVVEKSPRNGTDSFANPTVGTTACTFETGKSYVFASESNDGTAYTITEGSYLPCTVKILAEDSDGIKSYDSENSLWAVVGELPLTEEMFLQFGMDSLPNSVDGLRNAATLHYYTDDPLVLAETQNHKLHIWEIVTSKPKTIIQIEDFLIPQGKLIEKIEMRTNITGGKIRMALSVDGDTNWPTFIDGSFVPLDISNTATFLANGISPDGAALLDMAVLNGIINGSLRLAYVLDKPKLTDICKLKAVKITYVQ